MNKKMKPAKAAPAKKKDQAEPWDFGKALKRPVPIFGKPVARDILFSNHRGVYRKSVEKRQRWLLVKISFIRSFLAEGELIMMIAAGYAPMTKLERFLLRYLTVFQRRALFVFTNRRVFYIPTTFTYGYRYCLAEIIYQDCKSIEMLGRSLVFQFHNGESKRFPYIGRKERRKLKRLAGRLAPGKNSKAKGSRTMTYLCSRCGAAVPDKVASCPKCRLRFSTPAAAGKMALLVPGGGYFYLHNTLYGVAGAILESLLLVLLIMASTDMYHGFRGSIPAVVLLGLALAGIKTISFYHTQGLVEGCFPVMGRLPSMKS